MSKMFKKLAFVLAFVSAILVAGTVLTACDGGRPDQQSTTI